MQNSSNLPSFLNSYEGLAQHFRAQFEHLNTVDKGSRFAHFVSRLIPQTDVGKQYEIPELNPKMSDDGGIDLTATEKDVTDARLYVQAKLWIDRAEDIDSIMSKFQASSITNSPKGQTMFPIDSVKMNAHYLIITLSPIAGIVERYEQKMFASRNFYELAKNEHRLIL